MFEKKYFKYKSKYMKSKINQNGGAMVSIEDETRRYLGSVDIPFDANYDIVIEKINNLLESKNLELLFIKINNKIIANSDEYKNMEFKFNRPWIISHKKLPQGEVTLITEDGGAITKIQISKLNSYDDIMNELVVNRGLLIKSILVNNKDIMANPMVYDSIENKFSNPWTIIFGE